MEHLLIGLIVGFIIGLTGAGGALVSIPLFILLLDTNLKEATVLSLIAVMIGGAINLFGQKERIDKKIVIALVLFGTLGNYLSLPLKVHIPEFVIAMLLAFIGGHSLWNLWCRKHKPQHLRLKRKGYENIWIGVGLGVITTLTGLGGGIILVPLLISFYNKSYSEALPTSLMIIFILSALTFLMQREVGLQLMRLQDMGMMVLGAVGAFGILQLLLKNVSEANILVSRKIAFTLVTIYSVVTVMLKSY